MKKHYLLYALLSLSYFLYSQETKKYSGAYCEVCDREYFYNGSATYSYIEDSAYQRVFNGDFKYSVFQEIYGIGKSNKISINGSYKNNLAEGLWSYNMKLYNPKNEPLYLTYGSKKIKLHMPVTTATGNFINGARTGKWELTTVRNSKIEDKFIANFKNQKFVSEFSFSTVNYSVNGMFNDNGLVNGDWNISWNVNNIPYKSVLSFREGILEKSISRNLSSGEILDSFDKSEFMNSFFENLKENIFFSVVDDKIYILKYKDFFNSNRFNYRLIKGEEFYNYNETMKGVDIELLQQSLTYWTYSNKDRYDYEEYTIFSEIIKGIAFTEYKPERIIVKISEDDLLKLSDSINIQNNYVQSIKDKRQKIIDDRIKEEKRIIEEQRKIEKEKQDKENELENQKNMLRENLFSIHNNKFRTILDDYKNKGYGNKKQLFKSYDIIKDYYMNKYNLGGSYYSPARLEKSNELVNIFIKICSIYINSDTKSLEKQLKTIDNPEEIITLINNYELNEN